MFDASLVDYFDLFRLVVKNALFFILIKAVFFRKLIMFM